MPECSKLQEAIQKEFEIPKDSFQSLQTHNSRINEKYRNSGLNLQQMVMDSNSLGQLLAENKMQWEIADKELDKLEALVTEIEIYVNEAL